MYDCISDLVVTWPPVVYKGGFFPVINLSWKKAAIHQLDSVKSFSRQRVEEEQASKYAWKLTRCRKRRTELYPPISWKLSKTHYM